MVIMKRLDKIRCLDTNYVYRIKSLINNEFRIVDSFSDLQTFLEAEREYWRSFEQEADSSMQDLYSHRIGEIIGIAAGILDLVDEESADSYDVMNNRLMKVSIGRNPIVTQNRTVLQHQKHRDKESKKYYVFEVGINTVLSSSTKIENIVAGYKEFYVTGRQREFTTFMELVNNNGSTLQNNLFSSTFHAKEAGFLYFGLMLQKSNSLNAYGHQVSEVTALKQQTNELISNISSSKSEFADYTSSKCAEFNSIVKADLAESEEKREQQSAQWNEALRNIDSDYEKRKENFNALEKAFKEKLHLEAPIEFWTKKSKENSCKSIMWFGASVAVTIIIMVVGSDLMKTIYDTPAGTDYLQLVPKSFVLVAIVSLLIYILRTFIKVATSHNHVSIEYAQKASRAEFYLSILRNNGEEITAQEKLLIYSSLFAKVDTGLVKNPSEVGSDIETILMGFLSKDK